MNHTTTTEKSNKNQAAEYGRAALDTLTKARGYAGQGTSESIKRIDLVDLVQNHGVALKKSGARYIGRCPFHDEKTPSFFVYPNNTFYCFGCGASGDAATFIMKIYGCSFPEALERLGIRKTGKPFSPAQARQINKVKAKRALVESFRAWEADYSTKLGKLIVAAYQCLFRIKTEDDRNKNAWVHSPLSVWEYHLGVLCYGSNEEKYQLFKAVSHG